MIKELHIASSALGLLISSRSPGSTITNFLSPPNDPMSSPFDVLVDRAFERGSTLWSDVGLKQVRMVATQENHVLSSNDSQIPDQVRLQHRFSAHLHQHVARFWVRQSISVVQRRIDTPIRRAQAPQMCDPQRLEDLGEVSLQIRSCHRTRHRQLRRSEWTEVVVLVEVHCRDERKIAPHRFDLICFLAAGTCFRRTSHDDEDGLLHPSWPGRSDLAPHLP